MDDNLSNKASACNVGVDIETSGMTSRDAINDYILDDKSLAKAAADYFGLNSLKASAVDLDYYKDPTSDIPLEEIEKYKYITRQENYWRNKQNDLAEAIKMLTAYNIDIDYTDVILRAKEASRFREEFTKAAEALELKYPYIDRTINRIYNNDDINHDPITSRMFRDLERNRHKFSEAARAYELKTYGNYGLAGKPGFATSLKSQGTSILAVSPTNYKLNISEDDLINASKKCCK